MNSLPFAELAFPVLETCASLHVPQCVHEAVQTMVYLAPLEEAQALRAIAATVPADGPYAGDPLTGTRSSLTLSGFWPSSAISYCSTKVV